jgi:NAD-dependent dihydropyrimidine dehydrogenase PreA subunit
MIYTKKYQIFWEETTMIRQIIKIDEEQCNGCGLCVSACHEGAIQIIDGKAKLIRDDYCDGLGNCLPVCPTGAIGFETREGEKFNEAAVQEHLASLPTAPTQQTHQVQTMNSQLRHWPVQIQLIPYNAPYFNGAHLLIAADCTAFAHPSFNQTYMKNKVVLIGCPKLDHVNYTEKLTGILQQNAIKSVTVVKMEVPCCNGLLASFMSALKQSGKIIPWSVITLDTEGSVLDE